MVREVKPPLADVNAEAQRDNGLAPTLSVVDRRTRERTDLPRPRALAFDGRLPPDRSRIVQRPDHSYLCSEIPRKMLKWFAPLLLLAASRRC